jgi:hypothetical protein
MKITGAIRTLEIDLQENFVLLTDCWRKFYAFN